MSEETKDTQNDQEKPKSRMNINSLAKKATGGNKTAGIIIAVCMMVIGILIFVNPLIWGLGIAYFVTVGFIIYGIYEIIAFARTPADIRNGWTIANGIIFTLLGIMVLVEALVGQLGQVNMLSTFSFIIGFFALFDGITQISSYGIFKKSGEPGAGWVLASGILNILLGIFIICAPIVGWFTIEWIFAIYLIIGGIALFAQACSGKLARKQ